MSTEWRRSFLFVDVGQACYVAAAVVLSGASHTAKAVVSVAEAQVAQKGKDDGFLVVDDLLGGQGDVATGYLRLQPGNEKFVFGSAASNQHIVDTMAFGGPRYLSGNMLDSGAEQVLWLAVSCRNKGQKLVDKPFFAQRFG